MKTRSTSLAHLFALILAANIFPVPTAGGDEPLHQRIDNIIDAARIGPAAEKCSDGDFVRRIHLNLVGVIPTAEEARDFIDDDSADKRVALIDRLLADERFSHHMRIVFDAMLMERRPEKHIKNGPWRAYLLESFQEHKPLNQLAREILWAGPDDGPEAAARFYLDREVQPHLVTRDIGRMMLGRDLQCAQCHDHPVIGDYAQAEYYGIYAFINRSYLFTEKKSKKTVLAEKAEGDVSYESVFEKGSKYHTGPQLPSGVEVEEPELAKEELYKVKPPKDGRGVPAFSRRQQLAEKMTAGGYAPFNRNMANRLWAVMFGRGIVHPLDLHHTDNPPAHPELLQLLANELAAGEFDIRALLREIALSDTYQRGCELPANIQIGQPEIEKVLTTKKQQLEDHQANEKSLRHEMRNAKATISRVEKNRAEAVQNVEKAEATLVAADKKLAESVKKFAAAQEAFVMASKAAILARKKAAAAQQAVADDPDNKSLADEVPELDKIAKEAQATLAAAEANWNQHQSEHSEANEAQVEARVALEVAKFEAAVTEEAAQNLDEQRKQLAEMQHEAEAARVNILLSQAAIDDAELILAVLTADNETAELEARDHLLNRSSQRFFVYGLQPLSPEQMALSLHQAMGDLPVRIDAARKSALEKAAKEVEPKASEVDDKPTDSKQDEDQPSLPKIDDREIDSLAYQTVYSDLQGVINELVGVFLQTDGQPIRDFEGRATEALYLVNSSRVKGLVGGRLAQRLAAIEKPDELAEELYLSTLSRRPSSTESEMVIAYLAESDIDRGLAIQEMIWGLVSSVEFRFNH